MKENNTSALYSIAEFLWEMIKTAVTVVIIVYLIKTYVFQLFIVDGQSMEPTLHHSQMLLVDKLTYQFRSPKRGEIIVFQKPSEKSIDFIKRIIGVPGDTVIIENNHVTITNEKTNEKTILDEPYLALDMITTGNQQFVIKENEVFVLGDNRTNSQDSRVIGTISDDLIIGKALFTYWPIKDAFWVFTPQYNI